MSRGAFDPVNHIWKQVFEEYYQANEDLLKLVELLLDVSRHEADQGALGIKENIADSLCDGSEFRTADNAFLSLATIHFWINRILLVG